MCGCFNSRSPSGLRLTIAIAFCKAILFQFTQPKRAATLMISCHHVEHLFQFTQPKRAATLSKLCLYSEYRGFNSRSPSGLRLSGSPEAAAAKPVSIHAAQAGCDAHTHTTITTTARFQFTQPKRAATFALGA